MSKQKESSDSLAHPVVEPAHIVVPERRRTAGDYFAFALATRAEKLLGKKDPGAVVVDEVAGQLITFLFVPWQTTWTWTVALGFIAFRVFDIWKPYPVRRLEGLGGGVGIMADDMLAGFYAATAMSLLVTLRLIYY